MIKKNKCYVCKVPVTVPHPHYTQMCTECGDLNEKKRLTHHDLSTYIALITGGRTRIGYYTSLRLLRDGARVIVTSRFPYDALQRYIEEPDFDQWKDRIHIYGLDFRQITRVEEFSYYLNKQFPYIDIIINNAAQTVRMPEEEYNTLLANESLLKTQLDGHQTLQLSSSDFPITHIEDSKPLGFQHLQPTRIETDLTTKKPLEVNSWMARPQEVSLHEMLEVQLINVTAPFLLNTKLQPAMLRSPNLNRFIINVSSVEGKFDIKRKNSYHIHTNMAKASLNMMTLTMAKEYKKNRIYISSVDPGWVSHQAPNKQSKIKLPLDFHDAAARICDPIYKGRELEKPPTGVFFKDYKQVGW